MRDASLMLLMRQNRQLVQFHDERGYESA
jgi:hypothetical protein